MIILIIIIGIKQIIIVIIIITSIVSVEKWNSLLLHCVYIKRNRASSLIILQFCSLLVPIGSISLEDRNEKNANRVTHPILVKKKLNKSH